MAASGSVGLLGRALFALVVCAALLGRALDEEHSYHEGNYGFAGLPRGFAGDSRGAWDYADLNAWPPLCRTGSRQSPISFTNVNSEEVVRDSGLQRLQLSPKCLFPREETQMRIVNEGAVNTVTFERQGRLPEDLSECTLRDPLDKSRIFYFTGLHFHARSEHQFRTLRPDVEMHITFATDTVKAKNREVLMIAVMLKASTLMNTTSVRALRHILVDGSLPKRHAMTTCFLTEDLPLTSLLPTRESYMLYDGSQTHPPCTENVRWIVMTSPIFISRVALGKLRDAMDELLPNDFHRYGNARPPQALNGRRIYRFDDTSVPAGGNKREGTMEDTWNRKNGVAVGDHPALAAMGRLFTDADLDLYGSDDKTDFEKANTTAATSSTTTSTATPATSSADTIASAVQSASDTAAPATASDATRSTSEQNTAATTTTTTSTTEAPESSAAAGTTTEGAERNTTAEAASASTTKKPANGKPKKGPRGVTKNTSVTEVEDSATASATRTWTRVKAATVRACKATAAFVRSHPVRAGLIALCGLTIIFLVCTCCRGWQRPVYVVGIDPAELQPINAQNRFDLYGGTGTAAVRPAYGTAA